MSLLVRTENIAARYIIFESMYLQNNAVFKYIFISLNKIYYLLSNVSSNKTLCNIFKYLQVAIVIIYNNTNTSYDLIIMFNNT
jgi:hypothetical protein